MLPRRALMNDKIVSAQGENLSLVNVKGSKLNALSVYGKSMQSGTPSPENPVPIVSAGDGGEINVNVGGKNLLPFGQGALEVGVPYKSQGRTYTLNVDGSIDISTQYSSTPTGNVFIFGGASNRKHYKLPPGQYSFSTFSNDINATIQFENAEGENTRQASSTSNIFTIQEGEYIAYVWLYGVSGSEWNGTIYPQIEIGKRTAYEPYKTPQTLTAQTPGGLPGIPVLSRGNYTDESGQQWICDEIDLKRGKYVRRVSKVVVDGANLKFEDRNNGFWNLPNFTAPGITQAVGVPYSSNYFPEYIFVGNYNYDFIFTMDEKINPYFSSNDELNAFCAEKYTDGQPLEIYYPIDPIETDLPAEEISAYNALHTYTPNTTVSNDAEAWMKVGYREYRR